MTTVTIFYPNTEGSRFDMDYYLHTHLPMTREMLKGAIKGMTVEQGQNGGPPDSRPPYAAVCRLLFDSPEAFYTAFMPHAEALQGDIPNYTNVEAVIQISEVRLSE